ncbi:MAG: hypothetical protein NTW21_30180 [Verrucomicrobia bacterium]|nr:hypothetical protein [Verrucomicrobiota bacterium]
MKHPRELMAFLLATALGTHPGLADGSIMLKNQQSEVVFDMASGTVGELRVLRDGQWQTTGAKGPVAAGRRPGEYLLAVDGKALWFNPQQVQPDGKTLKLTGSTQQMEVTITWTPVPEDAFLITYTVKSGREVQSLALGLDAFNLAPDQVRQIYCLPHSVPHFLDGDAKKAPAGLIDNGGTWNNTFSLIADATTYSVSILPPEFRLGCEPDPGAAKDYWVGFRPHPDQDHPTELAGVSPNDGSILLVANHQRPVKTGETVTRRFLLALTPNGGGYTTGFHLAQFMNLAGYRRQCNSMELYRKSMAYLLDNPCCYVRHDKHGENFMGSNHSGDGTGYGNGFCYYAMYGNSFTVAAFNQYARSVGEAPENLARLQGPNNFLLKTAVQNPNGSFWSMLPLNDETSYVDQAYRKWIQTHATGWIAYYLLIAHEIGGDPEYLAAARKALQWLASIQRDDGSYPKYFENGTPSTELQGDCAWNALAMLKASQLKIDVDRIDFKARGLRTVDWICNGPLKECRFQGSFEDVGGVVDSYCSSVSAHAAVVAYEQTKDEKFLTAAEQMLSVSLAWVTCDYAARQDQQSWDATLAWQPAYGHVESTTCWYPCSYTLPLAYLVASDLGRYRQGARAEQWTQVARCLPLLESYLRDNDKTKCKWGMEWRIFPFLVFSEWGNSQTCWATMEIFKNRAERAVNGLQFDAQLRTMIDGQSATIFAPKWGWPAPGPLVEINPEVDPLVLKTTGGDLFVILLAEGRTISDTLKFAALAALLPTGQCTVTNVADKTIIGTYGKAQLQAGIPVAFKNVQVLKLSEVR